MSEPDYTGVQCAYCEQRFQIYAELRAHRHNVHRIHPWIFAITEEEFNEILNKINVDKQKSTEEHS